jgi:aromatase
MHSDIAIDIDAPAPLVFALASDVERWATLLPHYVRSRAIESDGDGRLLAEFVARRPLVPVLGFGLPVAWRSRTWNEPEALRLRFLHVAGATRGMDVTWRIEPRGDGRACRVTIGHDFAPRVPGFARFVDRVFTRPIAGRTLATFKALAEALADVDGSVA